MLARQRLASCSRILLRPGRLSADLVGQPDGSGLEVSLACSDEAWLN